MIFAPRKPLRAEAMVCALRGQVPLVAETILSQEISLAISSDQDSGRPEQPLAIILNSMRPGSYPPGFAMIESVAEPLRQPGAVPISSAVAVVAVTSAAAY
jgi:hypothetical protein